MTSARALLLDEMLSAAIARRLRDRGVDAVAVVENGSLVGASDEDVLEWAASERRRVVTANIADFVVLTRKWQAAGRDHAGIVYLPNRAFPQNRSYIGAVVNALGALIERPEFPSANGETFLQRAKRSR